MRETNKTRFAGAKVVATIEARMASTRLAGKVLLPLVGKPCLEHIIARVKRSKYVGEVVLATTQSPADDALADLAKSLGTPVFRGSEEDVLGRVHGAVHSVGGDILVEITGDSPLVDPYMIDAVVSTFLDSDADYCNNAMIAEQYVVGLGCEAFPVAVLDEVERTAKEAVYREHPSYFIYTHPERFKLVQAKIEVPVEASKYRLTMDMPEDYSLISRIYDALYPKNPAFGLADVVRLFRENPALLEINANVQQRRPTT